MRNDDKRTERLCLFPRLQPKLNRYHMMWVTCSVPIFKNRCRRPPPVTFWNMVNSHPQPAKWKKIFKPRRVKAFQRARVRRANRAQRSGDGSPTFAEYQPQAREREQDRRKRQWKRGSKYFIKDELIVLAKVLHEIRYYQRLENWELVLLPWVSFKSLVQEIANNIKEGAPSHFQGVYRWEEDAISCLQIASEALLVMIFEILYLLSKVNN